ncbi:MAG TPA: shikimate dehydrogenase [Streptosporangiaceae bacterium]|jgi:shikimate dehydrogenase|nr:shikimate dehydrogenase [Streptosporangiaceae bacterium]
MNVDVTTTAVDQTVRRAAVLGSPIEHSLSPVLHEAAYQALGLHAWHYDKIECDEPGLPRLIGSMGPEWAGLSLTMPLKRIALTVADEVSPLAEAVGAANTLVFPPAGGRRADNTDVAGIVSALREAGLTRVEQAVILGAGGTAQSALAAVRELGHQSPTVLVRNLARTGELRETAERLGMRPVISDGLFTEPLPAADLVISTLPADAADPLSTTRWKPDTMVLDVVYAPWPTSFAGSALAAGCPVVSGLTVVLYQAVAQVELMTGCPGPVEAMRTALVAAVAARRPK